MFTVRNSHGWALHSPLFHLIHRRSPFPFTCRQLAAAATSASARRGEASLLNASGPVAERLAATEVWPTHPKRRRASPKPAGDKTRVNVVSDKLCDDILSYIGPSLKRHRGCDILDLYPGAGLWSSKLHEFLKPRSHILLEPDEALYRPFLQPLLDRPGTTLVPKSGIIWRDLNSVLTPEYLPRQIIPDDLDVRNNTLLVTANLAFHPKKRFLNFESITSLVLHQFVNAIRTGGLFQRYGLVRMLIWIRTDDKINFIPRNIQRRKRQSIENELVCEWVHEVCGGETAQSSSWFIREDAINNASLRATLKRMKTAKLKLPPGREPEGFQEAMADLVAKKRAVQPGKNVPTFKRAYHGTLADLQAADIEQGGLSDSTDHRTMSVYKWRAASDAKKAKRLYSHIQQLDKIIALRKKGEVTPEELTEAELEWETTLQEDPNSFIDEFVTYKDNLLSFRRKPPLLQWDRRGYEPMTVQAEEFFPNIHCSLLDIQPKAPHPLLRQVGPNTNRAGDVLDVILAALMNYSTQPLSPGLDSLWPGASSYILPRWTSGQDLSRGGFLPGLRSAEPIPRLLDSGQWEELLELWMEWPFQPQFHELVGRTHDDLDDKFDEGEL